MLKKEVVPEQSDSQESQDLKSEAESNAPDVTLPDTKRYDRRGKPKFEGTTSDSSLTDIENSPSRKSETTSDKDDKGKSPLDASATEAKSNSDIFSDSIIDQSVQSSLSIITNSDRMQEEANLKFKNFYSVNS